MAGGALAVALLYLSGAQPVLRPPDSLQGTGEVAPVVPPSEQASRVQPSPEQVGGGLAADEVSAISVFQRSTPSVVNISNIRDVIGMYSMDVQRLPAGLGSGFVWDKLGHVVTNYHVIKGASEVRVTLLDQRSVSARVVGVDPDKDVAVLALDLPPRDAAALIPVTLGSSSDLLVGQRVFAIGNPFGLDHTLTQGIISGVGRELNTGTYPIKNVIQTDAAINPGNSGGVLLDSRGRLIGIATAIVDPSGTGSNAGVGFAIPIDTVKGLVEQILTYGRVMRPVLGITIAPPQALRVKGQEGVLVLEVPPGSPADRAGLRGTSRDRAGNVILGDVIVSLDGSPVRRVEELLGALDSHRVGDTVTLGVKRGNASLDLKVRLGERVLGSAE